MIELRVDTSIKNCPSPHSLLNRMGRTVWGIAWLVLFRPSPKPVHFWRRFLLRCFGARIGAGVCLHPSARIWAPWNLEIGEHSCIAPHVECYCVDRVRIGSHATVSQHAFLCTATHDYADPRMKLITSPVTICEGAWVGAGAFVGPGVTIGEGAVAGARAVVVRDVGPWTVVAGNPARTVNKRVLRPEWQVQ